METKIRYRCQQCTHVVHPTRYRSRCPRCGGRLHRVAQQLHADRKLPTYLRFGSN